MNESLQMVLVFIVGLALGTLFFAGLWFTVQKLLTTKKPALWMLGSFFLRVGITLIGFYYLAAGSWQNLLSAVLGFIVARLVIVRLTRSKQIDAV